MSAKKEEIVAEEEAKVEEVNTFTSEELHAAWKDFSEQRRKFQAEYQLLAQPYEIADHHVIIHLLNPIQETILNNIKSNLTIYLRENLRNNNILVSGVFAEEDDKKMMYTSRDKFDFLLAKNPALKEMKDRLGLDSDF